MNKKTIALFGGSGGLGTPLIKWMEHQFKVLSLSSDMVDVTNFDSVDKFFKNNDIDIVINLSGYNYDSLIHKLDQEEEIDKLLNVNIKGNINILRGALPSMREKEYGRIILASSVLVNKPTKGAALYTATKAFADSLIKTASAENISKGITCNSLQLGYFDGGMCHRLPEKFIQPIKNSIGLQRWGTIKELYQTILYLVETEYVTGQNINISGGVC
jgi:NAD(P)-dependent dehydrogenase (short-subunit alcohol dehydrogenase family)